MEIQILNYQPQYKVDFKRLNMEWISQYFEVEPLDVQQLEDPQKYILDQGGRIFFAELNGEIIGTVALKKVTETEFELSKMAVSPKYQGMGVGRKLGEHLIDEAQKLGCKTLFLESNQKLIPAIKLYKRLGFQEVPVGNTPYSRSNFRAQLYF